MKTSEVAVILKRFDSPDETKVFEKGCFDIIRLGGVTIGRARYEPGWRWSEHIGPSLGQTRCPVEHVGLVLSGIATAAFDDGRVYELRPGQAFYIHRFRTTAGSSAMSPTCRYISLVLTGTRNS